PVTCKPGLGRGTPWAFPPRVETGPTSHRHLARAVGFGLRPPMDRATTCDRGMPPTGGCTKCDCVHRATARPEPATTPRTCQLRTFLGDSGIRDGRRPRSLICTPTRRTTPEANQAQLKAPKITDALFADIIVPQTNAEQFEAQVKEFQDL